MCLYIVQKSWDIALGPMKQIPMNMFIMWMSGNSISIFPIMMVGMMFFRPIQALFAFQQSKSFSTCLLFLQIGFIHIVWLMVKAVSCVM